MISTKSVCSGAFEKGSMQAGFDYTPYGEIDLFEGSLYETSGTGPRFTGHILDTASQTYFAPFRNYAPGMGRWMTPDPLGMVDGPNLYGYVKGRAINYLDLLGLKSGMAGSSGAAVLWDHTPLWRPIVPAPICAVNAMVDNYSNMREANTIGADKYFHCKANCEAAKCGLSGPQLAAIISFVREVYGQLKGNDFQDMLDDMDANKHGRTCPDNKTCGERCGKYRVNGLDERY